MKLTSETEGRKLTTWECIFRARLRHEGVELSAEDVEEISQQWDKQAHELTYPKLFRCPVCRSDYVREAVGADPRELGDLIQARRENLDYWKENYDLRQEVATLRAELDATRG